MPKRKAICLFSSAGIGELGIKNNDIEIIASSELLENRHELYKTNYPKSRCFLGDIRELKHQILDFFFKHYQDEELFLVYATPPCQGMSSNSIGRLRYEVRQGNRPEIDERNRLILPAMEIISKIQPTWILFENVPGMECTIIQDEKGNEVNIMDYIERELGDAYAGKGEVVSCSDYGIPQTRKRLITIYTKDPRGIDYFVGNGNSFFPKEERLPAKILRDAIGHLPPLDARKGFESAREFHEFHYVPVMKDEKYWWVSKTPEGDTAYNNQCVNPDCKFEGNPLHRDVKSDGRWQSNKRTPIYCAKCGELLPRPNMVDKKTGERRLIKGFHSAYRRMQWDQPARAITRNFQFEASDNKIHPDQNRVLSIYEAIIIQSISDYDYSFKIGGNTVPRSLIADILGESVPPRLIDTICRKMIDLS